MRILVLEDKLGITAGYLNTWERMVGAVGFSPLNFIRQSIWRTPGYSNLPLLIRKGNRKSPGFNPEAKVQNSVREWFNNIIQSQNPDAILIMDVALLGLCEPGWDIATIDYLRGGVYWMGSIPILVTVPISAIHTMRRIIDIRAVNDGAESETDWEEQEREADEIFYEPYTTSSGRWILQRDLQKLRRLMNRKHGMEIAND